MKDLILKYALQNAIKYNGKANSGALIGRIIQEKPELKHRLKELSKDINETVKEVNALSVEEQTNKLKIIAPEMLEEKEKVEYNPLDKPLPNAVDGKVVTRVAPSPSGPLHVGHAYVSTWNSEYAKKYHGKFLLRLEDTNADNLFEKAYDMIPEELNWITDNNVSQVYIQSSRLEEYYKVAEKIISMDKAYLCTCDNEKFKENLNQGISCPCRNLPVTEQLERWKKMFTTFKEGEVVMRIKTDISHPNPAMRDWPAFRINETPHPKTGTKYRVWPLMNFSVAVDDHIMGITHTVRGKDHMDNEKRQKYLYDYLGWKMATNLYVGRINFEGFDLSTTQTKAKIKEGIYSGWDDIRLPFLESFKRRGYQAEAFRKFALSLGLTESDKTVSMEEFFKVLNSYNREVLDPITDRYFLVEKPVLVEIENAPDLEIELNLHPDHPEKGKRFLMTSKEFYLSKEDVQKFEEGKMYRLMDCLNFIIENNKFRFVSQEYEKFKNANNKGFIMHYLPAKDLPKFEVLMPDATTTKGFAEFSIEKLNTGTIIQAERFGFIRLDSIDHENKTYKFWFTHK